MKIFIIIILIIQMLKLIKKNKENEDTDEKTTTHNIAGRIVVLGFQHLYTMLVVIIGWVMFRASGLTHAKNYILSLFGQYNPEVSAYNVWLYLDKWTLPIMVLGIIMCTPLLKKIYDFLNGKIHENILTPLRYIVLLLALLLCVLQVASNTYSAFIYFQF